MYTGEPKSGLEFYKLLYDSEEFTSELGKVTLASGKLEAEIKVFLNQNNIKGNFQRATLGQLIEIVEKNKLFSGNFITALKQISKQRNYITHNIYALFSDLIDETILEKNDLIDLDVTLYISRVWHLNQDLNGLANLIKEKKK
ncbi:hypothetical protein [Robertkochia sediminum]|uniref:hypothetical protein n=1 Tax=Robertkochia sediminum TaxID=2785326 RepID=UPI00193197E0|nr:hypothetical protein [Robertkochia sediminum]MBL7473322.1 hypothetical protein [Robertkochia sediminum]